MKAITRRSVMTGAIVAAPASGLFGCSKPAAAPTPSDPLVVDDQSRLNATRVSRNVTVGTGPSDAATGLREQILAATAIGKPLCIGGARHSMGGQSLPPSRGFAATLAPGPSRVHGDARTYSVPAGARWRDVIRQLDPHGLSPAVTQSNNDFSIGGALSVNAHGWAVPFGPIGSTVQAFRLMLADGSIASCSPNENSELFGLCLGGYGLMGIVLDADLASVPNVQLERTQIRLDANDFAVRFQQAVHTPDVRMAYGRLSLHNSAFLKEAILVTHRPSVDPPATLPPARSSSTAEGLSRALFRGQTGSDAGKRRRWWAETRLTPRLADLSTRNSLMNVPVRSFAGSDLGRTDILHEYFVPPAVLNEFLGECRRLIRASDQDLLNVTLRWIEADRQSVMSFAPDARIALVMLFSQVISDAAESDMRDLTRRLIDAALAAGGSFYLPYRLHARPDQIRRAYPEMEAFLAAKRRWDPGLRFRNQMWDTCFAGL